MGFVSDLLGTTNKYEAQQAKTNDLDYASQFNNVVNNGLSPQKNLIDYGQADQTRTLQNQLAQALMGQAQGAGNSLSQNLLTQATNRNIAQGAGQIAGQKGLNPALAARLIAQNTGNLNQQAANQGAQLLAQNQMTAQNALAQALMGMRQQDISQGASQTQAGMDLLGATTNRLNVLGGLNNQQNQNIINNLNNAQTLNQATAAGNQKMTGQIVGGVMNALGPIPSMMGSGGGASGGGSTAMAGLQGDAGMASAAMLASDGGKVPGQAEVPGDSVKNDKVPALLSPGEIVVPRTAAKSPEKAKAFIDALMAHHKTESEKEEITGYSKVLAAHRQLQDRLAHIERMACGGMVY